MNKAILGEEIAAEFNLPKTQGVAIIESITVRITAELKKGGEVNIAGFGQFLTKTRKGRIGVNPRTKEKIEIPPIRVPKFKAGKNLKEAIKG